MIWNSYLQKIGDTKETQANLGVGLCLLFIVRDKSGLATSLQIYLISSRTFVAGQNEF